MSDIRNDIPILEYDTDPTALFAPDHEHEALRLPERAVFAFLGGAPVGGSCSSRRIRLRMRSTMTNAAGGGARWTMR
ncbi:MAG: hypothetical protein K5695_15450 [Oscillospiraceae bacterium]|nr:hypothetical protein [Oscillospiraceae bacterium]